MAFASVSLMPKWYLLLSGLRAAAATGGAAVAAAVPGTVFGTLELRFASECGSTVTALRAIGPPDAERSGSRVVRAEEAA